MPHKLIGLLAVTVGLAFSTVASATLVTFDFTDLGQDDYQYPNSTTFSSAQSPSYTLNAQSLRAVINYNNYVQFGTNNENENPSYQPRHSTLYYTPGKGLGVKSLWGGSPQVDVVEAIAFRFDNLNTSLPPTFYNQMLRLTVGSLGKGEQVKFYVGHTGDSNSTYVGQLTGDGNGSIKSFLLPGSTLLNGTQNLFLVNVRTNQGHENFFVRSITTTVPEPPMLAIFGLGLIGLWLMPRRYRA